MPKYRVTYFNDEGRAETARQMLEIAGADWEDVRLTVEQWADVKPKTVTGQVPFLEEVESGFQLFQSNAINRYLANKFGLAGETPEDAARADMILDTVADFVKPMEDIFLEKDETRKKSLLEKFKDVGLEEYACMFERILSQNKKGDNFFVGDSITVADILFAEVIGWPPVLGCSVDWEKHPKLKAIQDRVHTYPQIAAWMKKRPVSQGPVDTSQ